MSNETRLLQALLNGEDIGNFEPRSRMEAYLKNCCLACGCDGLPEPITETDALLYQLADKINAGESERAVLKSIIDGTATEIIDDSFTSIKDYAFCRDGKIRSVEFNNVITVGAYSFSDCPALISANFPNATTIKDSAFYVENVESLLTSARFPKAINIGDSAFANCKKLTDIQFTDARIIGFCAFCDCASLTELNFPNATDICDSAFENCNGATSAYLPNVVFIGAHAFRKCTSLRSVVMPKASELCASSFEGCSALTHVDFHESCVIDKYTFKNCTNLNSIILRSKEYLAELYSTEAFYGSGIVSGGAIYVPAALVEQYKAAKNWKTLYDAGTITFVPIEGSEYE